MTSYELPILRPNFSRPLSPSKPRLSPFPPATPNPAFLHALTLLSCRSFSDLEQTFLANPAFLTPFTDYRDSFLLLTPSGMPRTSLPGRLTREAVLWMYNVMDEGGYRTDPLDIDTDEEEEVTEGRKRVDKSAWEVLEHEKFLYAWLLQSFRVGKVSNEFGYFRTRNICQAFEEVFRPVVEMVVGQYDPRGRRHYGQFASFVENLRPSMLAFPEQSVGVTMWRCEDGSPPPVPPKDGDKFETGRWMKDWKSGENGTGMKMGRKWDPVLDKPIVDMMEWLKEQKWRMERRKLREKIIRQRSKGVEAGGGKKEETGGEDHQRVVSAPARMHFRTDSKGSIIQVPGKHGKNFSGGGEVMKATGHGTKTASLEKGKEKFDENVKRGGADHADMELENDWDNTFYAQYGFEAF